MCIKRKVLAPKIYEVSEFLLRHQIDLAFILLRHQIDLAFITETWLKESIDDSVVSISGYCVFRRDRKTDCHAGVCTYVNTERLNNFTVLDDLNCCEQHELLWLRIRPLEEYRLQSSLPRLSLTETSNYPEVPEIRVQNALSKLPTNRASGPDKLPNWVLNEYSYMFLSYQSH